MTANKCQKKKIMTFERSHSKKWSKTSICENGNYFWDNSIYRSVFINIPKFELPKLIIWHNIGPISVANSRLLLFEQCRRLHQPSAGPTEAAFVDSLNLPTYSWNLAQYRPCTKPIVTFTMVFSSESRRAGVQAMDGTLLGHVSLLPKQTILEVRKPEFGTASARFSAKTSVSGQSLG